MVRLTDRPDMTLDVYRGRKTTNQQLSLTTNGEGAEWMPDLSFVPFQWSFINIRMMEEY